MDKVLAPYLESDRAREIFAEDIKEIKALE